MLYRYEQTKGKGFTGLWMFNLRYEDAAEVSEWAYEAVCWMTMNEIIGEVDGKFDPKSGASRALTASAIYLLSKAE